MLIKDSQKYLYKWYHKIKEIRCNNIIISKYISECPKIEEIKSLEEFLIKQCGIKKEDLDNRGNTIYFNLSRNNKKGPEKYDPPHGCIGIGIKCIGKYESVDWLNNNSESSEWPIEYHGVGNHTKHTYIKPMINNIVAGIAL